jgi:hypothetical protein
MAQEFLSYCTSHIGVVIVAGSPDADQRGRSIHVERDLVRELVEPTVPVVSDAAV